MRFRPCIDIHNGKVKQIVGGSLKDEGNAADENFVSEQDAAVYAELYKKDKVSGGHVILLNSRDSEYYEKTKMQAKSALGAYPGGLQAGGGITPENADEFLDAGASHVIVTSYVFKDGRLNQKNLEKMISAVGREHLVLDLSCRKKNDDYYIVTDRWQNFSDMKVDKNILSELSECADEFLVHGVDVEGKAGGVEKELVKMLGEFSAIPVTYAGGVASYDDIREVRAIGSGRVDITIGSALDLFGGRLSYKRILELTDRI